jgi:hypothetical protein
MEEIENLREITAREFLQLFKEIPQQNSRTRIKYYLW